MGRELNDFICLIEKKQQTIMLIVVVFLVIAVIVTFAQPLKYSSESRLLVVQNFPEETDPYAISKSNEYLSSILAKIVTSNLFYNDIMNSGFPIDKSYFLRNNNTKKEMKKWRKTVQSRALSDTGIIEINVYHPDRQQLGQIANAVNFILKSKHNLYHGAGDAVTIKIIDKPILSNWPTKPNILLNILISVIFALVLSFSYIYLFPEKKYNLRLWSKRKKKSDSHMDLEQGAEIREEAEEVVRDNWQAIGDILNNKIVPKETEQVESIKNESLNSEVLGLNDIKSYENTDDDKEENKQDIKVSNLNNTDLFDNNKKEDASEDEGNNLNKDRKDYFKPPYSDLSAEKLNDKSVQAESLDNKEISGENNDKKEYNIFEDSKIKIDSEEDLEDFNRKGNINNLF